MKIAFLLGRYPHLTETFLAREIESLRELGMEIEIFSLWDAGSGARAVAVPNAIYRFWPASSAVARGRIWAHKIAAEGFTHIHAAWANEVATTAQEAAQTLQLPWSFAAHARDLWVEGTDFKKKLASARFAFVCTRAGEAHLKQFGDNVIYAPHGLPLEHYPMGQWTPQNPPRILGVGRLVEKKGWPVLVEALRFLPPQTQLRIVGDGPLKTRLPRENLLGALSHREVIREMRAAHCLVLPSIQARDGDRDGLANVILEAAALGVPVVSTRAGSADDFLNKNTGWLCEKAQARELARVIRAVFADTDETRRRCLRARQRVENEFDARSNARVLARAFGFKFGAPET